MAAVCQPRRVLVEITPPQPKIAGEPETRTLLKCDAVTLVLLSGTRRLAIALIASARARPQDKDIEL